MFTNFAAMSFRQLSYLPTTNRKLSKEERRYFSSFRATLFFWSIRIQLCSFCRLEPLIQMPAASNRVSSFNEKTHRAFCRRWIKVSREPRHCDKEAALFWPARKLLRAAIMTGKTPRTSPAISMPDMIRLGVWLGLLELSWHLDARALISSSCASSISVKSA